MTYTMPPVPVKYEPKSTDSAPEAATRAAARTAWIAARQVEIDAGTPPQRF